MAKAKRKPSHAELKLALRAVEAVTFDDWMEDMTMRSEALTGDLLQAYNRLSLIYRLSHAWNGDHSCYHVHDDWRKEVERFKCSRP